LKQRTPRQNRGSTTSCATAFGSGARSARHYHPLPCRTRTSHDLGGVSRR
jgi:hypothetical protein